MHAVTAHANEFSASLGRGGGRLSDRRRYVMEHPRAENTSNENANGWMDGWVSLEIPNQDEMVGIRFPAVEYLL